MKRPQMLWVDDDIDIFSGLEAYLAELEIDLVKARTLEEAIKYIAAAAAFDVLLLDMFLLRNSGAFSLERYSGVLVMSEAIKKGTRHVVLYTVLGQSEIEDSIKIFETRDGVKVSRLEKGCPVAEVVSAVTDAIGGVKR